MKGYIDKVFLKYVHTKPKHPQLTPHKHREIKYGTKQQLSPADDTKNYPDAKGIKRIHLIIGALLYYSRSIGGKLLVALSAVDAQQAATTEDISDVNKQLLDYAATYPNYGIFYCASKMVLAARSNAGFQNESKGHSRTGSHTFFIE